MARVDEVYEFILNHKEILPINQDNLAEKMKIDPSNLSKYLKKLENESKIIREIVQDGRKRFCYISLTNGFTSSSNKLPVVTTTGKKDQPIVTTSSKSQLPVVKNNPSNKQPSRNGGEDTSHPLPAVKNLPVVERLPVVNESSRESLPVVNTGSKNQLPVVEKIPLAKFDSRSMEILSARKPKGREYRGGKINTNFYLKKKILKAFEMVFQQFDPNIKIIIQEEDN